MSFVWILPLVLLASVTPPDLEALGEGLVVATDGKGHYIAAVFASAANEKQFYGDGKTFYVLKNRGSAESGFYFEDPRFANYRGRVVTHFYTRVQRTDGGMTVTCGQESTTTNFYDIDRKDVVEILRKAKFERSPHDWEPYILARDDFGRYYYVDRGRWKSNEKHFRVFVGFKGKMQQKKLKNVVHDSEGDVFATKSGSLRLVTDFQAAVWITEEDVGKKRELVVVPPYKNMPLIHNELGVYRGARYGTPCDDN